MHAMQTMEWEHKEMTDMLAEAVSHHKAYNLAFNRSRCAPDVLFPSKTRKG